jgi:hypothetical protein
MVHRIGEMGRSEAESLHQKVERLQYEKTMGRTFGTALLHVTVLVSHS